MRIEFCLLLASLSCTTSTNPTLSRGFRETMRKLEREQQERNAAFKKDVVSPVKRKLKAEKAPIPQVKVPPKHPPAPPAASSDPNHVAANMRHDAEAKMRHDTAAKMRHEMMKHTQKKQALNAAFEKDVVKPVMRRLKRNA